ncbi:MAG: ATP-binding protein [Treponema sp.]|nr:ATP-binding protein [Treponema sp.]
MYNINMKRLIENKLHEWKNKKDRKPLLLVGARQIGKSYSVLDFGKNHYTNIALFNLETSEELRGIFDNDLDPKRIVQELEGFSHQTIKPQSTLIFFDEIQACGKAITALKYFCEQAPEYHIIAAGSLLGSFLVKDFLSFPVGKVDRIVMYPMTFQEFLMKTNPNILPLIEESFNINKPLALHERALELFRAYLFTGGMPKAVLEWTDKKEPMFVSAIQQEILSIYDGDMGKYATPTEQVKTRAVYNSIPSQLVRENKKFQYSLIGSNARAVHYEIGLERLFSAGLALKCLKTKKGEMPVAGYADMTSYKVYMNDVGLLNAKLGIPAAALLSDKAHIGGEIKGALTENYVMQELTASGLTPHYWESDGKAEIDFVIQLDEKVIPVEVKAADNVKSKSLSVYVDKYKPAYSIRISAKNFGFENGIKSVPLYAVWCIK